MLTKDCRRHIMISFHFYLFFFISFEAEPLVGHCRLSSMGPQSLQIEELNDCEVAAIIKKSIQELRQEIMIFLQPQSPNENLRYTFAR